MKTSDVIKMPEIEKAFPNPNNYDAIKDDIATRGIQESLVINGANQLLCGYTRLAIAEELGLDEIPIRIVDITELDEMLEYAILDNIRRRQLTDLQLVEYGMKLEELYQGRQGRPVKGGQSDHLFEGKTRDLVANKITEQAGTKMSGKTYERLKIIATKTTPEVKEKLNAGDITREAALELAKLDLEDQRRVLDKACETKAIKRIVRQSQPPVVEEIESGSYITLSDWNEDGHPDLLSLGSKSKGTFNDTNENIEWAKWTWNPVRGCLGPDGKGVCEYCYARDSANRFEKDLNFEPAFHPDRLVMPHNSTVPKDHEGEPGIHNVFVCSMGDLFGEWIPQEWIDAVLSACRDTPQWTYIFLTKNPKRYIGIDFPNNAWVGATIDVQSRVSPTIEALEQVEARIKFVSCEPLLEAVTFPETEVIDWIIIGGRSKNSRGPALQPQWSWVEHLWDWARERGVKVYFKPNLTVRPKEYPEE